MPCKRDFSAARRQRPHAGRCGGSTERDRASRFVGNFPKSALLTTLPQPPPASGRLRSHFMNPDSQERGSTLTFDRCVRSGLHIHFATGPSSGTNWFANKLIYDGPGCRILMKMCCWEDIVSRINLAGIATVLIISAFFLCPTRAMPQGVYGTIGGLIADPSGAAVPGVSVKVINTQTGVTQNLTTNSSGLYNAVSLLPGTYKIEADAVGFKSSVVNGIVLEVNANAKVDLTLQIGQATE